jgi:hypothetical protein
VGIPMGEAIIAGSALFATMGVIIKYISYKQDNPTNGHIAVSRRTLDEVLDRKMVAIVTDKICLSRHEGLERHVSDLFDNVGNQMTRLEANQEKVFEKLDEIKKCQFENLKHRIN